MTRSIRSTAMQLAFCIILASWGNSNAASLPPHQQFRRITLSAKIQKVHLCSSQEELNESCPNDAVATATNFRGGDQAVIAAVSRNPVNSFLKNLWKGITLPFPALRKLVLDTGKKQNMRIGVRLRESIGAVAAYLTVGVMSYHLVLEPSWTIVDSMYFTVTSFTTVGYGDLCPTNLPSKAFACVFGLVGISFLGAAIATLSTSVINSEIDAIQVAKDEGRKRLKAMFEDMPDVLKTFKSTSTNEQDAHFELARGNSTIVDVVPSFVYKSWRTVRTTFPSLFLIFAGGALIHKLNGGGGPWWDAAYYSVVTASTIGLGDISPMTRNARIAAIFYIPLAVAAAGELLSGAASAMMERRQKQVYKEQLENGLTIKRLKDMDADGSGRISRAEYIKFMLVEMGLVEEDELDELDKQFERLDVTRSGYLDKEDLALMAKYRGVEVAL